MLSDFAKKYDFVIRVSAWRYSENGSGNCVGHIHISLGTLADVNDILHLAIVARLRRSELSHPQNFNQYVIEVVSELISELN